MTGSLSNALQSLYPTHPWQVWRFKATPRHSRMDRSAIISYFDSLACLLGLKEWQDWYGVRPSSVQRCILAHFKSLSNALQFAYPKYDWQIWKFQYQKRLPLGFWDEKSVRRSVFAVLEKELNLKTKEEWKSVQLTQIKYPLVTEFIRIRFGGSILFALQDLYGENFLPAWKFGKVPLGYWNNRLNVVNYLKWIAQQLYISTMEAWYQVSSRQIQMLGGIAVINKYGGIPKTLEHFFPSSILWQRREKFVCQRAVSKDQQHLANILLGIFSLENDQQVLVNFRHPDLLLSQSRYPIEYDLFIPELSLAIEYQGPHHYQEHHRYGRGGRQAIIDKDKREVSDRHGITEIVIPYWWRGNESSLLCILGQQQTRSR